VPVEAVEDWLALSKLTAGPLFRKIDRWGHLSEAELTPSSIIPMLRKLLSQAGVTDAEAFSSHSLRRGFAQWAGMSGWDIRELMNYVGWRDVKAAMRYLDGVSTDQKARFEQGWIGRYRKHRPPRRRNCPACPRSTTTIEVSIDLPSMAAAVVSPMPCGT
jgi:integrase